MGKVSIALRGWRFDEEEVFTEEGELRSIDEVSPDTRDRLVRLSVVAGQPCSACWLIHGDEDIQECNVARVVYGEPLHEVILCNDHEPDFLYWYQEAGGSQYRGEAETFEEAFQEWFADGNRAPEGYEGMQHVETDPDSVPQPDAEVEQDTLEEAIAELDDEERQALETDFGDLDI
ncbi:hypothetical protein DP107_08440 [Haloglomus irregulare]|jgi:hypothetical protein|uniref:Uncharacterized protein n=1 Tax=Haloglomus irregulare TaxID=2234134 RepID=A0A554NA84_9EURY|nr:hypothetical protein [Haloglomus irregulare]TSD14269.1 hypothetical protein DP107_08440 [Haloglomus irregulare]